MSRHIVADDRDGILFVVGRAVKEEALLNFVSYDGIARLGEPSGHKVFDIKIGVGIERVP